MVSFTSSFCLRCRIRLMMIRSSAADKVTDSSYSIDEWKNGGWKAGVANEGKQITSVTADLKAANERHAVFYDASESSGSGLKQGQETLMVNASIMDVGYHPVNAPWVVDLDLPKGP